MNPNANRQIKVIALAPFIIVSKYYLDPFTLFMKMVAERPDIIPQRFIINPSDPVSIY